MTAIPTANACRCGYHCDPEEGCPLQEPTTEPGALAPVREQRMVAGSQLVLALVVGALLIAVAAVFA
jgi:hypothetical protein